MKAGPLNRESGMTQKDIDELRALYNTVVTKNQWDQSAYDRLIGGLLGNFDFLMDSASMMARPGCPKR